MLLTNKSYFYYFWFFNANNKINKSVIYVFQDHTSMKIFIFITIQLRKWCHTRRATQFLKSKFQSEYGWGILRVINCSQPHNANCNSESIPPLILLISHCTQIQVRQHYQPIFNRQILGKLNEFVWRNNVGENY